MKRKFSEVIKSLGCNLLSFKPSRSDMGFQQYDIAVSHNNRLVLNFSDSYCVGGEKKGKEFLINVFRDELTKAINKYTNQ